MSAQNDIALVSLGTTPGLRRADAQFAELAREAGATCDIVDVNIGAAGKLRRQVTLTDLVEARAARRAAKAVSARAVVYSTVTAALLQPRRGRYAVRFDSPASLNRSGLSGAWQRRRERDVLAAADLLLPWGRAAAQKAPGDTLRIELPVALPEISAAPERDIDAVAYAGYPRKRGLDVLCAAWNATAPEGARLVIGGVERERGVAWLERHGVEEPAGAEWPGRLPEADWLALVSRARLFVNASRWEDHGLAQLEALAAGAALVTVRSPGAYEALPLAHLLDVRLVSESLEDALRAGLALGDAERAEYAERARELLIPYRRESVLALMRDLVLPRLLA